MSDTTFALTFWKGRLEYIIDLDDGHPDGAVKDRFIEELRTAREALGYEDNDALTDWLHDRHRAYLAAVRVWADRSMARMTALAEELES